LNAAELKHTSADYPGIRFIAVSATIPNVEDVRQLRAVCHLILLYCIADKAAQWLK